MNDIPKPKSKQPANLMGVALIIAVATALTTFIMSGCACSASPSRESSQAESPSSAATSASDLPQAEEGQPEEEPDGNAADGGGAADDDGAAPDFDALASIMGDEEAEKLIAEAETDPDRHWIATHPDAIAFEGDAVQMKLLTLAADDDAAVPFVRQFAELYPSDGLLDIEGIESESESSVPRLYQWDQRWGYTIYSSTAFGLTGCGPTAFAMAYQGVTGKNDLSPYDMSLLAQDLGYMAQYEGTSTAFFSDAAPDLGMSCKSLAIDESSLRGELAQGNVVIANMTHGYFSHFGGHFLVVTGIDGDGKLVINDPYSVVHSRQTWDIDFILGESKGLYSFSLA